MTVLPGPKKPPFPERIRIGTPSGVGDVYWCLTKLRSFRERHKIKHVTLCVQKSHLPRSLQWPEITDLVDEAIEFPYQVDRANTTGYYRCRPGTGMDCVFWPNTVIDTGQHLSKWMPDYDLDLDLKLDVIPPKEDPGILVYASSEGVNKAWFPQGGPKFWGDLLNHLQNFTGRPATLIGAGWDEDFARLIDGPRIDMIAETDLKEVMGVIKSAQLLIGIISGMTILGNHFGTPTLAIVADKFPPAFPRTWVRPEVRYLPIKASQVGSPLRIVKHAIELVP